MSDTEPETWKTGRVETSNANLIRWLRFLGAVIGILLILWFLLMIFFLRYLPSHAWLETIEPFDMILGATASLIIAVGAYLGFQSEQFRTVQRKKDFLIVFFPFAILLMVYFPMADLLRRVIPAMIAVGWGERVEHRFFVLDPDEPHHGRGRCRREIVLRDMPMLTMLCNMPSEFHDQLQPRTDVVFIGKGTWMGLFVEDFRKP